MKLPPCLPASPAQFVCGWPAALNLRICEAQTPPIGAVTNRWTMEMQQAWRFRLSWKPGTSTIIVDTQSKPGGASQWFVSAKDDGSTPDDYLLVCRIHSAYTGGLILVAAGLKQFGTEAAGRLLADPDQLGTILGKLSPGWENKNLQVVLHARVIGNTPALPEVVASMFGSFAYLER